MLSSRLVASSIMGLQPKEVCRVLAHAPKINSSEIPRIPQNLYSQGNLMTSELSYYKIFAPKSSSSTLS